MLLKNLNELKSMNIQINQIISVYENLGKDIEKNFFDDVKQKIAAESSPVIPSEPIPEEDKGSQEDLKKRKMKKMTMILRIYTNSSKIV